MTTNRNALRILDKRIGRKQPDLQLEVAEQTVHAAVAQIIYDARKRARLTQAELGDLVGTQQPVIARLERADYEGHSLSMLNRIAKALNLRLMVQLTTAEPQVDERRHAFRRLVEMLRRERGLTIAQLGEKSGIDPTELAELERNPSYPKDPRTLVSLADFYGVPEQRFLALAGANQDLPPRLHREVSRFAAMSDSFTSLTPEERRMLDKFVACLREDNGEFENSPGTGVVK